MPMHEITFAGLTMRVEPETFRMDITLLSPDGAPLFEKHFTGAPVLYIKDGGPAVSFAGTACESETFRTGTVRGVRVKYSGFRFPESEGGRFDDLAAILEYEITNDGWLRYSIRFDNEPDPGLFCVDLQPVTFGEKAGKGYTVLPRMQGLLLPAEYPETIRGGEYAGLIFDREAYMPVFGQVTDADGPAGHGFGYTMIVDTPYDAKYVFRHPAGGDTTITPRFISQLGRIGYKRTLLYHFDAACDFVTMAKLYRGYVKERGRFTTLREKFAKNPNAAYLVGTPIIHSDIAGHIVEGTHYYEPGNSAHNDWNTPFAVRAEQLKVLKENGLEKAYLHLDGWGRHGYDNLHPDVFPPHEGAGGAEGMKLLADTCNGLGFRFGIHDQYRDYYYDAPSFDINNAVMNQDGGSLYINYWYGGAQTLLCAKLALEYVKRNYDEFKRLGIDIRGSYLDVFSVVELDECFNPDHRMTREECARYRRECFAFLTSRGIIPSSEETVDCYLSDLVLCHHAPYFTENWDIDRHLVGYPLPLFNLVYHECVITPWFALGGTWGIPDEYDPMGLCYMNGGTVYWSIYNNQTEEENAALREALAFQSKVCFGELLSHELVDGDPKHRRSTFATEDGGTVTVDIDFHDAKKAVIKFV
ncbi:MAG: DUF5696 domain-containing protein [Clostridia bacterium]|nr:DUF5696 domain-containing protein [Clostridia bacterium]